MPKKANNTIKLYRELMAGITLEDVKLPTIQDGDKYRDFCRYCDEVYTNDFFELIRKEMLFAQVSKTAIDSQDVDQLQFGRAVINGLALVDEIFKKYSMDFQEKFLGKGEEDFNPNDSFNQVS